MIDRSHKLSISRQASQLARDRLLPAQTHRRIGSAHHACDGSASSGFSLHGFAPAHPNTAVIDDYNREAIGMETDFSLPSERVIRELKQMIAWRGKPQVIRCDNGPEYVSAAIQDWAAESGIKLEYIQPGNPQQNAYVERFNRTVRYEWLSHYYWSNLEEVQAFATQWMWSYNNDRPNMALGGFTPRQKLPMAA